MSTAWTSRYAQRTKGLKSSAIRELLKFTQRPEVISFAGGLPAPEVFPAERFQEACQKVLQEKPHLALQYGATEGYEPLREMVARHIARYGIKAKSENVLITSGSQQALDLIGKLLINPGDRVLVEAPTYLGALQAFNVYGADYVSVPSDDDGLRSDLLEDPLRSGPKFMYVLPNFQNPGGTTLSEGRRHELVLLADKYGIPIVEDDPYGQLRYEGEHLTPLVVLDRENLRRDRRLLDRQRTLPEHVLENARSRIAPGMDRCPSGCHRKAGSAEAGRRPAHFNVRADGRLRSGAR